MHIRHGEFMLRLDHAAAFEAHHLEAGVGQFHGDDGAGDTSAYDNGVYRFEFGDGHFIFRVLVRSAWVFDIADLGNSRMRNIRPNDSAQSADG